MLQDGGFQRNRAELDDACSPEPPQPAAVFADNARQVRKHLIVEAGSGATT
jgi:hypothetical protein